MLLIVGYRKDEIEKMRHRLKKMGYPSFGSTFRSFSKFPYKEEVTGVFFPYPVNLTRTERVLSPIKEAFPHLPILAFTGETFPEEDAIQCKAITKFISPHVQFKALRRFLLTDFALCPKIMMRPPNVFRHCKMDFIRIGSKDILLNPAENTLFTFFLCYLRKPLSYDFLRAGCFSLTKPPTDNGVSAAISRLNRHFLQYFPWKLIEFEREKGYYFY